MVWHWPRGVIFSPVVCQPVQPDLTVVCQPDLTVVGVAVAVDEGLLVPVIRFADGKTMPEIGADVRELAKKAKTKKVKKNQSSKQVTKKVEIVTDTVLADHKRKVTPEDGERNMKRQAAREATNQSEPRGAQFEEEQHNEEDGIG